MKKTSTLVLWSVLLAGLFGVASPAAAQLYWDPLNSLGIPGSGGSGSWDNTTTNWFNGSADIAWTANDIALFEGATAGTVTVNANVSADGLTFTTAGYNLITGGASAITLAGGTPTITVPTGTTTIGCPITGGGTTYGLIASGPGTLALSGANTYAGTTFVTNGATLSVNTIADSGASAISTGNLLLEGGTLAFTGTSATTTRNITNSGATPNFINVPGGSSLTVNGSVWVAGLSNTVPQALTTIGTGTLYLGGTSNDNSGLTLSISNGTVVVSKTTYASAHGVGGGSSIVGTGNANNTAKLQLAGSGGFDLYSACILTVNGPDGILDLNGQSDTFSTLTNNNSGSGWLINSSATASTINPSVNGVVLNTNTTIGGGSSVGPITISSKIIAPNGAFTLTQAGPGLLTLGGASTFSGGLNINAGTAVTLTAAAGAGTGTIAINGNGVLTFNAAATYANAITGGSTSVINVNEPSGNTLLTGSLSGFNGTINCNSANGTSGQLVINNANNANNPISSSATWNIANGATIDLAAPYNTDAASVILNGTGNNQAFGSFRLDACDQTGNVLLNGNTTIGNGNVSPSEIDGVISDNGHGYGFSLVTSLSTSGGLLLTAPNTYSGATVISNSTLFLNGAGSIANSSGIYLANGTTFDVSGVNGGTYFLGAGQMLATLGGSATINGNVDVSSGSPLSFQYNTANAPLNVTGTLNLNNNHVTVDLTGSPLFLGGTVPLVTGVSGTVASSVVTFIQANAKWTATPTLSIVGNTLYLTVNNPVITTYLPYTYTNLFMFVQGIPPAFSLAAVGTPTPTYKWYSNGVAISGANNTNFSYKTGTLLAGLLTNSCVVSSSAGIATNIWVLDVVSTNFYPAYPLAVMQSTNGNNPGPPIAYWRLDESDMGSGNTGRPCNDWVGGNMGAYTNVNLGQGGYSAALDPGETSAQVGVYATSDSVADIPLANTNLNFGAPAGSNVNFSVECWINAKGQGNSDAAIISQGKFGNNDDMVLAVNANGNSSTRYLRFYVRNAGGSVYNATTALIPSGSWEHLVGVCNESAGTVSIYVNGTLTASSSIATASGFGYQGGSALPVVIGGEQGGSGGFSTSYQWNGLIDDVAIYNYALTASEIAGHYNSKGTTPTVTLQSSTNVDYGAPLALSPISELGTTPLYNSWSDTNTQTVLATTPTLNIAHAITDKYFLVVSNVFSPPASTNTVIVTAYQGAPSFASPGFNITPQAQTVYVGVPVTLSVLAYGTYPLSYQWYNGAGSIVNQTNSTYTVAALPGANTYYCVVTGGVSPAATSSPATVTGVAFPSDPYGRTVLTSNTPPIAYWRLNETNDNGSGNYGVIAYDYVGGHEATYNGVYIQQPVIGADAPDSYSPQFGTFTYPDSYAGETNLSSIGIQPIDVAASTGEFSVEAWVQADGSQINGAGILAKGWYNGGEQFVLTTTNDNFCFYFKQTDSEYIVAQSGVSDADGNWHHLVGICDQLNGVCQLYVDGLLQAGADTQSGKGVEDPGSSAVQDRVAIGARAVSNTANLINQFVGSIAEVAIYNYPLSPAQIQTHYQTGTNNLAAASMPAISAAASGNNLVLTFVGTLECSTNVTGPYTTNLVPGAVSPYTIPMTNSQIFFQSITP